MPRSVNKVILMGNLGRDAETTYTPSGQAITKFSIATSRRWQNKGSDEWQEETEWHNIVLWGKTGESLAQYLTKGQRVYVEGRIKSRTWEKDGVKHYATDIVAEDVVLAGGKAESDNARPANSQRSSTPPPRQSASRDTARDSGGPAEDISEDDIPF